MDENTCRLPLTTAEILRRGKELEALEKPAAKERQGRAGQERSGKLPEHIPSGQTRDKVGKALGVSGRHYEKIRQVQAAADADPERFGDLPAKMDAGSVDAAHKEMKARKAGPTTPGTAQAPPAGASLPPHSTGQGSAVRTAKRSAVVPLFQVFRCIESIRLQRGRERVNCWNSKEKSGFSAVQGG